MPDKRTIKIKIVTPERVVLEDTCTEVIIPTTTGIIGVLARHTPLVSILKPGEIKLKNGGEITSFAVSSGFVEVRPNSKVVILADTAEHAGEIDIERAETARQRAEKMLKEKTSAEDVEYAHLQAIIEKEIARARIARKYRKIAPKI
ncbi:ATP synthase F1 subunit epsilon [Candidatus Kuenenbacteria bacterium CG11_big_fil_rev_8_21_14_0_20_37_9]|uniref:ATP synthase epsilon chain n=2 Tax=Candidatus Kueneniibacteriota TaxID=1752740 RepID=A0A2M6XTE3_9BACT|nr:MAG: ATP synthase F1 subunit epsilon [Candidatus Kuenenbacteria bacterium CG1_02_38_13]PIR05422.1 MAG: ATP synthase F1 subunit epsilon [Candidatus Kuenenbacteria bacterium CG11_big_fil_rev_8_21_14_0_20_37_9]PIU10906.1 MAG: ATP synthase F1 subunit epsilon [Candidatus Kuenenbacteria bacterium CG08_land_8_20_14_0_20_37_23]